MMTFTVSPWLMWAVLSLTLGGLWGLCRTVLRWLTAAGGWWRDRRKPVSDEDVCSRCLCSVWAAEVDTWPAEAQARWEGFGLCLECQEDNGELERWEAELLELPPERSAGELGFTGEQPAVAFRESDLWPDDFGGLIRADPTDWHQPNRERRAPWWEAEHRAAYESLNLDYPSGLLARVREAGR